MVGRTDYGVVKGVVLNRLNDSFMATNIADRGSWWRRWDLHIHTNASDGKGTCEEILAEAQKKKISCIAVTDHHTFANIDEMKRLAPAYKVSVISGVEFRTEYGDESVHMIGLFPDEYEGTQLTAEFLHDNVLSPLGLSRSAIVEKGRKINPQGSERDWFEAGMFQVQVSFKAAADKIHKYGGLVTVHAGNKSNSIETMKHDGKGVRNTSIENSLGPVKEELFTEGYIDICDITQPKDAAFYQKQFGKPSIITSDAHKVEEVGSNYCWIKADTTFDGLRQVLIEPGRISFEEPEVFQRIRRNPDKFIKGLNIRRTESATMPEVWFDNTKIPLNPGMVAIIGNKGSGKSAIADILALCADSTNDYLSFLTPNKFRMNKPFNRSRQIEANIQWLDRSYSTTKTLDMDSDETQPKRVKYIPQNFLETICTTEEDEKFEAELKDTIDKSKQRISPEDDPDFSFDDIDDMQHLSQEIYKRRLLNALAEGASEWWAYDINNYIQQLWKISPDLPGLYAKIIELSRLATYDQDETKLQSMTGSDGTVNVIMNTSPDMLVVKSEGVIFPILLQQTIKGILEVALLQGLPVDKDKALFVMKKADFRMAEIWDSRLGVPLWKSIVECTEKSGHDAGEVGINFILMEMSRMEIGQFNYTMQNIFAGTKYGVQAMNEFCETIMEQREKDEFDDYIETQNQLYPIQDGYFTDEELIDENNGLFQLGENKKKRLNESQESKSISQAKKLIMDRLGYNESRADEFVRINLRNDLPVLRSPQGGKFILGVARMFLDGQVRSEADINNLNRTLKLVASDAHINEYDRNLNGMSCTELVNRFASSMKSSFESEKDEINKMKFDGKPQYDIVRIDSFEQASRYARYTNWCITYSEDMFDSYTCNGINQFYFCLRHGFKKEIKKAGDNAPLDSYGLSMLAVCVDEDGRLHTCTCRWNHDNQGKDTVMNAKEISQTVGVNFFETFKPNGLWKEKVGDAKRKLENGEAPANVFDKIYEFSEGSAPVYLLHKGNFIDKNNELVSKSQWFDDVMSFHNGLAPVELNGKWNLINTNGEFVFQDQWFDYLERNPHYVMKVGVNNRYNYILPNGEFLSRVWYDSIAMFTREGYAVVRLNDKCNFIDKNGKLLSTQWFDNAHHFIDGFARVWLDGKMNVLNTNGELVSPNQWFDTIGYFNRSGYADATVNGKEYRINRNGELFQANQAV